MAANSIGGHIFFHSSIRLKTINDFAHSRKSCTFAMSKEHYSTIKKTTIMEKETFEKLLKGLQKIQLENNHLYNEYDVPDHRGEDDEQKPQDEKKSLENADINKVNNGIDDKVKSDKDAVLKEDRADEKDNNKNKLTTSNPITEQSKQTEVLANTKKQKIEEEPINDIKNQKISQAKQVAEDNKNGKENAVDNINNKPNNTQATGIDWSLLEDNPDIEN